MITIISPPKIIGDKNMLASSKTKIVLSTYSISNNIYYVMMIIMIFFSTGKIKLPIKLKTLIKAN